MTRVILSVFFGPRSQNMYLYTNTRNEHFRRRVFKEQVIITHIQTKTTYKKLYLERSNTYNHVILNQDTEPAVGVFLINKYFSFASVILWQSHN